METVDAVVIGAGPNGLVAAALLADAGWDVLVLEAMGSPGGAVRSEELTVPSFTHDVFSGFYPLVAASPVMQELDLPAHGLRWAHAPLVLAHPIGADQSVGLHRDRRTTADSLAEFHRADGPAWLRLCEEWDRIGDVVVDMLLRPFPPLRHGFRLARRTGLGPGAQLLRRTVTPLSRWAQEEFSGAGAPALFAGCAMHSDLGPADAGSALFGWLLAMLGQQHGFPVPVGGAGRLTDALVSRATSAGARLETSSPVTSVHVAAGRAQGVIVNGDRPVRARRAVLADVGAPVLYGSLVRQDAQPTGLRRAMERFEWELPAVKVDWALAEPIPWQAKEIRGAGVIHIGGTMHDLTSTAQALRRGERSALPYAVLGQLSAADPTRSPGGTETAWAYAHLPAGRHDDDAAIAEAVAEMEDAVETAAPGFRDLVLGRSVLDPAAMCARNPNLQRGAMNGGTSGLHQQLVFRPVPGLGRADTPIDGLFLASASAHPGGGVHGACGANAARAALIANGKVGAIYRGALGGLQRRMLRQD